VASLVLATRHDRRPRARTDVEGGPHGTAVDGAGGASDDGTRQHEEDVRG
jgi:hypothetical protein